MPRRPKPSFDELSLARAATDFRFALAAAGRRDTTVRWYADILDAFIRFATRDLGRGPMVGDFELGLARRYAVELREPTRPSGSRGATRRPLRRASVRGHLKALKAFGAWLATEAYVPGNPLSGLVIPPDDQRLFPVFGDEQLQALLRVTRGSNVRARRLTAIVWLLLDTGMRLSELTSLDLDRLDLEAGTARVGGKGGKERVVPIGSAALYALRRYLEARGGPDRGPVLIETGDRPMSNRAVYRAIRELGRRAGINGVRCSPHTFRHTFATRYLTLGGDVLTLQRILGHSPRSLDVTRRYVTLVDADLRAAHRRFSPGDHLAGLPRREPDERAPIRPSRSLARRRRAGRPVRPARGSA
jgi:integrase/recombinase XerD